MLHPRLQSRSTLSRQRINIFTGFSLLWDRFGCQPALGFELIEGAINLLMPSFPEKTKGTIKLLC
jgi:hypothetical protein